MKKKRAQITVFIIIGIILLLSAILVVYLTTQRIAKPVEEAIIVPEDVKPVHEFITNCIYQTARRGTALLGQQGGYIYMPGQIKNTPSSHLALDPYGAFMIPFWYYEGEDRTPQIDFMQNELRKYIYDNIRICIGEFEAFQEQYDIKELEDMMPLVFFTENEIIVRMKWPLELSVLGRTTRFEDYATRLPVKIKQAWEIADKIMKSENENTFFENLTIELMSMDTEIPLDNMVFECKTRRWHLDDVKKRLQTVLYYNLPFVRVENTNHIPFAERERQYEKMRKERERIQEERAANKPFRPPEDTPRDAFQYWRMTMRTGQAQTDLKASFDYLPSWPMRFNGKPNSGGTLKSNKGKGGSKFLSFLCMNQWHFTYDIIYPIRVTIKDEKAYAGDGFVFQFAFPVIINSNMPERVFFGIKRFRPATFKIDFCEELGDTPADLRATGFTEASPFETELDEVNMTLRCFHEECLLGTTTADGGYYRLRTLIPSRCANPQITASKPGYLTNFGVLTGDELTIPLKSLKEMEYTVVVHPYNSYGKTLKEPRELKENEEVLISISLLDEIFDQFETYPSEENTLELVEETTQYSVDLILNRLGQQIGGYSNANLTIKYSDIASADLIEFHVFEFVPTPVSEETRMQMYDFMFTGAANYTDTLKPTFKLK